MDDLLLSFLVLFFLLVVITALYLFFVSFAGKDAQAFTGIYIHTYNVLTITPYHVMSFLPLLLFFFFFFFFF